MRHKFAVYVAVAVLALAGFLLFFRLGAAPIRIWDEAIYANNAVEMYRDGDLWVLKNDGIANLYNTKPPLIIWLQCLSMHLLEPGETAIRFPSALAAWLTVALLLYFATTVLQKPAIGCIAAGTLLSAKGFFCDHVARTGDLDAVLTLFITAYTLLYFRLLIAPDPVRRRRDIALTAGLVGLAFFSKSTAGLIPLAGLFVATLISREGRSILKERTVYLSMLSVTGLAIAYYVFRESLAPGYWEKVFFSEYKRLFVNIMPWHTQPFDYYWWKWTEWKDFYPFVWFLPAVIPLFGWKKQPLVRAFAGYATVWSVVFFLLISFPAVKLPWYDAPMLPVLSLLAGCALWAPAQWLADIWPHRKVWIYAAAGMLLLIVYAGSLRERAIQVFANTRPVDPLENSGYYLRQLQQAIPGARTFKLLEQTQAGKPEHLDATKFYTKTLALTEGYDIRIHSFLKEMEVGDTVVTCQAAKADSLRQFFNVKVIHSADPCVTLVIESGIATPQ